MPQSLYDAEHPRPKQGMPLGVAFFFLAAVLALGGYFGQIWWSRQVALKARQTLETSGAQASGDYRFIVSSWRQTPWYGEWHETYGWIPRRARYEFAKLATGQDLGDDPGPWEEWFQNHPKLVWDPKAKRLVDRDEAR